MIQWWGEGDLRILRRQRRVSAPPSSTPPVGWPWGSVGPALVGQVHIVDDDGNELPPGEIGTVFFGGERGEFSVPQRTGKTADCL